MSLRVLAATALIAAFLAPTFLDAPAAAQDPGAFQYRLIIDCPEARAGLPAGTTIQCPTRATDALDMMGSPSVAVDIRNPKLLVMASLHGQDPPNNEGPSERSRTGLPYTTFTSVDGGRTWRDNFFPGPADVRGSYGEHPQIVTDPYGHVYVGSLWARPIYGTEYQYVLSAQKFESLDRVNNNQIRSQGGYNVQYLDTFYRGNMMTQYWYVFDPRVDNMTIVWHEQPNTATPAPRALLGAAPAAVPDDLPFRPLPEVPHEMWAERPNAGQAPGPHSVIAFAWTNMTMKSSYHYAIENNTIGPCSAATNSIWSEGYIYVGCVAAPSLGPFRWNNNTKDGTVEIFRFQSEKGERPEYLGASPITSGKPKLGVRSDGRLALFSVTTDTGKLFLQGVFGEYKEGRIQWDEVHDYSSKVPRINPVEKVTDANIQDMEYREYSGAVHLILKEVLDVAPAPVDLGVGKVAGALLPKYRKTLFAIDERHGVIFNYKFDVGRITNRTDPQLLARAEENYNDLSDDLVQIPQINFQYNDLKFDELYHREFFAVGDYGIVIFAEIIELTNLRPPGVAPPPGPPPPVPAPALAASPTAVLIPLAGTSFAGLLAFALLANRRKNPLAAFSKGE